MQLAQLVAGLDSSLVHEPPPRCQVRVQRLGLAARPIQRQHPLRVQALAQRMLLDQALELRERLRVTPGGEIAVDRELGRPQPQILEPADLGPRERLARDVGQRRPAPQSERFTRSAVRDAADALRKLNEALEPGGVDRILVDAQLISAPVGQDLCVAIRQQPPQLRDVGLHHLGRGRRRVRPPYRVHQALDRHGRVRAEREHRQYRSLLGGAERNRAPIERRLDRPQQEHIHTRDRFLNLAEPTVPRLPGGNQPKRDRRATGSAQTTRRPSASGGEPCSS